METDRPLVLLVEDQPIILDVLKTELEEAGFGVFACSRSIEALRQIEARAAEFKAIVTDIDLGVKPDGWELAKRARELSPSIVVIYASGRRVIDWPHEGVPESVMLQKPFATAQLITALATQLNSGLSLPS